MSVPFQSRLRSEQTTKNTINPYTRWLALWWPWTQPVSSGALCEHNSLSLVQPQKRTMDLRMAYLLQIIIFGLQPWGRSLSCLFFVRAVRENEEIWLPAFTKSLKQSCFIEFWTPNIYHMKKKPVIHHTCCEYLGFPSLQCRKTAFNQRSPFVFCYTTETCTGTDICSTFIASVSEVNCTR